jgi:hypothetical protein
MTPFSTLRPASWEYVLNILIPNSQWNNQYKMWQTYDMTIKGTGELALKPSERVMKSRYTLTWEAGIMNVSFKIITSVRQGNISQWKERMSKLRRDLLLFVELVCGGY